MSAAAVGALAIAVGAWRLSVDLLPLVLSAETRAAELRELSEGDLISDASSLTALNTTLDELQSEARPAARFGAWVWRFSPAAAWLPPLEHEVASWVAQSERLRLDLASAATLLAVSSQLLDSYSRAQDDLLHVPNGEGPRAPGFRPGDLELSLASGFSDVTMAARIGRDHTPAFAFRRVSRTLAVLDEVEERMIASFRIGWQASALLTDLFEIGEQVSPLVAQFTADNYEQAPLTAEELRVTLDEIDRRLQFALVKSSGLAIMAADADVSDPLMSRVDLLQDVLRVLMTVNRATKLGLGSMESALRDTQHSEAGLLESGGGLMRVLGAAVENRDELATALALLRDAERKIADMRSGEKYASEADGLRELAGVAGRLRIGLELIVNITPIGPELVGADSTVRYLVLGQSADELRATGGFVSSVWLITFENGGISDTRYHDAVRVDEGERLALYPPAPTGLEEHMNAQVWLLRDVSWDPDFPTTAETAADMYKLGQRQDIDGVIAINQWALLALVRGLGSVPSPGGGAPMTQRNLLSKLDEGSDEYGRAYMDLALQGILGKLDQTLDLSTLIKLASALQSSFEGRDMLLYMQDPQLQSVVEKNGWGGHVRHDSSDYLYVVDSNVGWSKSDRNVERKVRYQVDLRKG